MNLNPKQRIVTQMENIKINWIEKNYYLRSLLVIILLNSLKNT